MKKLLIIMLLSSCFLFPTFGEEGNIVNDQNGAVWLIASNKINGDAFLEDILLPKMNNMPIGYAVQERMTEFAIWLKIEVMDEYGKVFPNIVYQLIFSKIIGYGYGNARIADAFLPPQNIVVDGTTITCDEDPTGQTRDALLYKMTTANGPFVEQAAGSLDSGTWTWTGLTAGTYVLAYDDNFESLPSVQLP